MEAPAAVEAVMEAVGQLSVFWGGAEFPGSAAAGLWSRICIIPRGTGGHGVRFGHGDVP